MDFDIVVAGKTVSELVFTAKNLGFRQIIVLYPDSSSKPEKFNQLGVALKTAAFLKNPQEAASAKNKFDYTIAPCERSFFEQKNVDFIIGLDDSAPKDLLYQRKAGLDDALCKLALKNKITLLFKIPPIDDKLLLGRMKQNIALCKKYAVPVVVATFSETRLDLRSEKDVAGFARTLRVSGA